MRAQVEAAFRDGAVQPPGTAVTKILPPAPTPALLAGREVQPFDRQHRMDRLELGAHRALSADRVGT